MELILERDIQKLQPLIDSGLLSEEDVQSLIYALERMVVLGNPSLAQIVWNIFEKMALVKSTILPQGASLASEFKGSFEKDAASPFKKEYRNPTFKKLLDEMLALHERKSHDYANDGNPYSNFEAAARFAHVTVDQVFEVLLGIKYARLWELIRAGKTPNNESIEDTLIDINVYSCLRVSYRRDHCSTSTLGK